MIALFVRLHNAGRSQMSAALFERAAQGRPLAEVRATRDDIRLRVEALVAELDLPRG